MVDVRDRACVCRFAAELQSSRRSYLSSHSGPRVRHILNSPPLVIIFRGRTLDKVMMRHRISMVDLNGALRQAKVANVSEVEVCVLGQSTVKTTIDRRISNAARQSRPALS